MDWVVYIPPTYPSYKATSTLPFGNIDILNPKTNVRLELPNRTLENIKLSFNKREVGCGRR